MSLADKLLAAGVSDKISDDMSKPVWEGPSNNTYNGGITFSLLSKYLVCKERFRLRVIEGLVARERFNKNLEYGNMWHVCEEAITSEVSHFGEYVGTTLWEDNLLEYNRQLLGKYPFDKEEIDKWYNVCRTQFPIYMSYWAKHKDAPKTIPLAGEQTFNVPYYLPSGRLVYLRGKWDRFHMICSLAEDEVWLQENKTKGEINVELVERQLKFDLQTMLYLIALKCGFPENLEVENNVKGVIYNVVRRPLSGGVGSIRPHKATKNKPAETMEQYYKRLGSLIDGTGEDAPGPQHYFMRWQVEVSNEDMMRFGHECFDGLLENLLDDYEWWSFCKNEDVTEHAIRHHRFPNHMPRHFRMPFGIYNPLTEDGQTEYDSYLENGNDAGLVRTTNLFPELQS